MPEHDYGNLGPAFQTDLGIFYLIVILLNGGFAAYQFYVKRDTRLSLLGVLLGAVFAIHALAYLTHHGWELPSGLRAFTTSLMGAMGGQAGPILYSTLSVLGFILFLYYRKTLTEPAVAWTILNLSFLIGGWSMTDSEFRKIINKEDNVPITMLIYAVGFFTWVGMRKAVLNDERIARGEPPLENQENEKVLVW